MESDLVFQIPDLMSVSICADVVDHLRQHRQLGNEALEAGGQLFATVNKTAWRIAKATGPRKSDWRTRFGFRPDRNAERKEIREFFKNGLHYVGDWHTHPESRPVASGEDLRSMNDLVARSQYELPGFLMIIVGTNSDESGLWLSLHTGNHHHIRGLLPGQQLPPKAPQANAPKFRLI